MSGTVKELEQWRKARGEALGYGRPLTFEEAAALVVVDGEPVNKSTWFSWEAGRKIPRPAYMRALCDLVGHSSDIFYSRTDGGQSNATPPGGLMAA